MDIPVSFHHLSTTHQGTFVKVSGAGSGAMYHLYVGGFYKRQLWRTGEGWRFRSQDQSLDYLEGELISQFLKGLK